MTYGATGWPSWPTRVSAAWGPRPGEPNCRVPPALLPESQTRRETAYALWRSTGPTSSDITSESNAARKPQIAIPAPG